MTQSIKSLLPAIILGLVLLAGVVWYMTHVPAPTAVAPTPTPVATEPAKIAEEAPYYTVDATYPTQTTLATSASAQADQAAVATMKTFVEGAIAQFKKDGNFPNLSKEDIQMLGLGERKYAIDIKYTMYQNESTLSYVYLLYTDTGGAHPNTNYRTFTFDKKTGALLSLKDVFAANAPYLQTLSTKSRAVLPGKIAAMENVTVKEVGIDDINSGTKPELEAFQNFYFEGSSLVLLFPPYQVGPYVLGMITLPIPTSELKDLKPEYTK